MFDNCNMFYDCFGLYTRVLSTCVAHIFVWCILALFVSTFLIFFKNNHTIQSTKFCQSNNTSSKEQSHLSSKIG